MRANVNLDTDAYNFAYAYARAKGMPLGAAISELLRRAEQLPEPSASESPRLVRNEYGYLEVASTGDVITPEMVKELSEDPIG
jgi:hypothetical protein